MGILLSSCTVTEVLQVSSGSESSSMTDINVQQYFVDVLTDFSEFLPSGSGNIMDEAVSSFASQLSASGEAGDVRFIKTGENSYTGVFTFDSFEDLATALAGGESQSIIRQDDHSLEFYVDIDNYSELENIVPFLADPNIEVFLAKYNEGYSEQDYMDMIVFSLGEEAPESLSTSLITINGSVPGRITSISGAEQTGAGTFSYSFPLIDFLLLSEPLQFTVNWD